MNCPACGSSNLPGAVRCAQCGNPLEDDSKTTTGGFAQGWTAGTGSPGIEIVPTAVGGLQAGTVLGGRYEIMQLLGEGGMGAVYKARDREVDRLVALKVIHPELARSKEILQRFKQELILARQVTHKNVIRIFDIGEADGIKFISMEFIEGQDLRTRLREKGKFKPAEAASIVVQVCRALDAAHSEGVVHRDLKPQNIMVDEQGRVTVMDFGIARSLETTHGLTQTGALVGTLEYMSPEQAKGEPVDARSDLFSLGIIFYELLTGHQPYRADTPTGTLFKRVEESATPPMKLDPAVPRFLNDVVLRCLEKNPQLRYQTAQEILQDLETWQGVRAGAGATSVIVGRWLRQAEVYRKPLAIALGLAILAGAGLVLVRERVFGPGKSETAAEAVSLAILPFRNASGDQGLDWLGSSLAEMLRTEVGQSSSLRTVSQDRLHQVLRDLRLSATSQLDPPTLRRLAEFSNAQTLVWGQYVKLGDMIRIDATLDDLRSQRTVSLKAEASNQNALLGTIRELAHSIRQNLALSSSDIEELQASSFSPSSKSVPALRFYNEGLDLARQGNHLEAVKRFTAATEEDPSFALAYAQLGQTYLTLGYGEQAQRYARQALDLSDTLPALERDLIQAQQARIANDLDRAIDAYQRLTQSMPFDTQILFELAALHEAKGSLEQAREYLAKVLAADPNHLDALFAAGRVKLQAGNYQASLDDLNRGLSLAIQVDNREAKARILHTIGINYKLLKKFDEALRYYEDSLAIKRELGDKGGMAATFGEMAQVYDLMGKPEDAGENYLKGIRIEREIGNTKGLADKLLNMGTFYFARGNYDQALESTKQALQLYTELGDEKRQALCSSNIGACYVSKGQLSDALTYYQRALQLREKWKIPGEMAETFYNLADVYAQSARYDEALTHYLRALELWRGAGEKEGVAVASNGMGILFAYQGRFGAALSAQEEALKTMRELQQRSYWLGEILAAYGNALSLAGRDQEAAENLQEAISVARELKNEPLAAKVLNYQGDRSYYLGDYSAARGFYKQALQVASGSQDRQVILLSKLNLAKVAVQEGSPQIALGSLKTLARDANSLGLKYFSAECSLYSGEAQLLAKNYAQAERELQAALGSSESLGLRAHQARTRFLLAKVMSATGRQADAARHSRKARQLLEEIVKEVGSDTPLRRQDLKPIYAETAQLT
jgi:tetratricopeptide (TPR) repeat protein/predicted Ser/Thr protein kinase